MGYTDEFSYYFEKLQKAINNRSQLVLQTVTDKNGNVKRVWVNPNKDKKTVENKTKKEDTQSMRIKSKLTKTDEITDYLTDKLESMGYDIETSGSALSGSRYITINNYNEITGKESKYNDNSFKIRISNHDLPPSYDGQHGYHDMDVMSDNKFRGGNDGNATDYTAVLNKLYNEISEQTKINVKNQEIERKNRIKENISVLPSWFDGEKSIKDKIQTTTNIETKILLRNIINGAYSNGKKPNATKLKEIMIDISKKISSDPDMKKRYSDF